MPNDAHSRQADSCRSGGSSTFNLLLKGMWDWDWMELKTKVLSGRQSIYIHLHSIDNEVIFKSVSKYKEYFVLAPLDFGF